MNDDLITKAAIPDDAFQDGRNPYRFATLLRYRYQRPHAALRTWWEYNRLKRQAMVFLRELLPEHSESHGLYWEEFFSSARYFQDLRIRLGPLSWWDFTLRGVMGFNPLFYVIAKCVRPLCIVETGVAAGYNSYAWLCGLTSNESGKVYSYDLLPSIETEERMLWRQWGWKYRPTGATSGWIIPDSCRKYWSLTLGDSVEMLTATRDALPPVDIFYHDSRHTYEHMTSEFQLVKNKVRQGGLILADDATENRAFAELAEQLGTKTFVFNNDLMALRMP